MCRSYYRCTHSSDQGCKAKRQVQSSDTDQSKYVVTYYGDHTCRDPSTIPLAVHAAAGEPPDPDRASNLISFGPSIGNNNTAAAASSQYLAPAVGGSAAADQLSTSWCTSDDVFSSSAGSFMQMDELIGAVVVGSSAGVTSSTPAVGSSVMDRGGGLGGTARDGGAASFPPSPTPNGLGFVVGSLGSIEGDDDDLFAMDDP